MKHNERGYEAQYLYQDGRIKVFKKDFNKINIESDFEFTKDWFIENYINDYRISSSGYFSNNHFVRTKFKKSVFLQKALQHYTKKLGVKHNETNI